MCIRDSHISASLAQLTLTMTLIGMAVGQILGGPVSDYLGRRNPLLQMCIRDRGYMIYGVYAGQRPYTGHL